MGRGADDRRRAHGIQKTGQRVQTHSLYILTRKAGLKSDPGKGVSSAHCPNCGAPITSDTSSGCSFCGAVLNDGTRGWVLSTITSAASDVGRQWTARISASTDTRSSANISRVGVLAWTVNLVAADGTVDVNERELLKSLAAKCHVDQIRVDQMIEMALAGTFGRSRSAGQGDGAGLAHDHGGDGDGRRTPAAAGGQNPFAGGTAIWIQ